MDVIDLTSFSSRAFLLAALLSIDFLLKSKSFRAPLDPDTCHHLYFAFLRSRKVAFESSYRVGVKYLLPRMYSLAWPWIETHLYRFRIVNFASSAFILFLWVFLVDDISVQELPFYFLGVLLIDSLWTNPGTSTTEFHSSVLTTLLLVSFTSPSLSIAWLVTVLVISIAGFKWINAAYLAPALALHADAVTTNPYLAACGLSGVVLLTLWLARGSLLRSRDFLKSMRLLSVKNRNFLFYAFPFCLMLAFLGGGNVLLTPWPWAVAQLTLWGVALVQRKISSFLLYPSLVVGFFIALSNDWLATVHLWVGIVLLALVFLGHTLPNLVLQSGRAIVTRFREKTSARQMGCLSRPTRPAGGMAARSCADGRAGLFVGQRRSALAVDEARAHSQHLLLSQPSHLLEQGPRCHGIRGRLLAGRATPIRHRSGNDG